MLYFNYTSVFHILTIDYCMRHKYDHQKATLLVPSHVENIFKILDRIKRLDFIENVIIYSANNSLEKLDGLLDISFAPSDIVHILGWEIGGLWMVNRAKMEGAKCIIIEEGARAFSSVKKKVESSVIPAKIDHSWINVDCFDEIWKLAGGEVDDTDIKVIDLNMKLKNDNSLCLQVKTDMMEVFGKDNITKLPAMVYFDTYVLRAEGAISKTLEDYLYSRIISALKKYDYVLKPHPGDLDRWDGVGCNVYKHPEVPYEISLLFEDDNKDIISLAYGVGGSITNQAFLFDMKPILVSVHKIFAKYGVVGVDGTRYFEQYVDGLDAELKSNVYEPESFQELEEVLTYLSQGKKYIGNNQQENYNELIASRNILASEFNGLVHEKRNLEMEICKVNSVYKKDIVNRDNVIADLMKGLKERTEYIDKISEDIRGRDNVIQGLQKSLQERIDYITAINKDIENRDGVIKGLQESLKERDNVIQGLQESLQERIDYITAINKDIENRDDVIHNLIDDLKERDVIINELRKNLEDIKGE